MIRQFVHATAGFVWVVAAAGLVWLSTRPPSARDGGLPTAAEGSVPAAASSALFVLVLTGVWNTAALGDAALTGQRGAVLTVKLVLAVSSFASGSAWRRAASPAWRILWALTAAGTGAAALLLGIGLDAVASGLASSADPVGAG